MPRETSAAIGKLFRGFSGYVQADAKSVYDLFIPWTEEDGYWVLVPRVGKVA